jgi:hypothetical protein
MKPIRVERSPAALWRRVGAGVLLTRRGMDGFHEVNESAAEIWGLLGTPMNVDEIVARLARRFSEPVDRLVDDAERLVEDLRSRGYVRFVDA